MARNIPKISFLIPAHNAQDTIERAIKSILEFDCAAEIIVAENGSTDDTTVVVKKLIERYKNIVLIHSEQGVSKARNAAIARSRGAWIAFVDADDSIDAKAARKALQDLDVIAADLWVFGHIAGKSRRSVVSSNKIETFELEDVCECRAKMLEDPTRYMTVWAKLFKASIIKENGLRFNESLTLAEDSDFMLRYTAFCNRICFSPEYLYNYSLTASSAVRIYDGKKTKQYIQAMCTTARSIEHEENTLKRAYEKYVLIHMSIIMVREIFSQLNQSSFARKVGDMKCVKKVEIFRDAIKHTKTKECLKVRMLPVLFFKYHLDILSAVLYWIRAKQNARRERRWQ